MKNAIQHLSVTLSLLFLLFTGASCSSDDDNIEDGPEQETQDAILEGSITQDKTLNATVDYKLTGILSVEKGSILTIPAGTHITTETGTDVYIAVQQGADIKIMGTPQKPVRMGPEGTGNWGGLLLLGKAKTTAGVDAIAEVGGLVYGGNNNADSSGEIHYLIIESSGAQINPEAQYNGLSLYAVGSGTTIENVAILGGNDDGIEFFGGAADVSNVFVKNLEDDAIDWTEGWGGSLTNVYVLHDKANFGTALEGDGLNDNPRIENFTAVSNYGGLALMFKANSGATITGLSLSGYENILELPDGGSLSNININGSTADPSAEYNIPATVDKNMFDWAL